MGIQQRQWLRENGYNHYITEIDTQMMREVGYDKLTTQEGGRVRVRAFGISKWVYQYSD